MRCLQGLATEFLDAAEAREIYPSGVVPFPQYKRNQHNSRWTVRTRGRRALSGAAATPLTLRCVGRLLLVPRVSFLVAAQRGDWTDDTDQMVRWAAATSLILIRSHTLTHARAHTRSLSAPA